MLSDTTPISLIVRANLTNFSTDEKARREQALVNKDYYYSKQETYLEKVNSEVDAVTLPLTHVIVNKKSSLLYSRPLVREFIGPNPSVSFLDKFVTETDIDFLLSKVDLASELTGTSLMFIGIDANGKTSIKIYDASEFSVVQGEEDPDVPQAISIISKTYKITGSDTDPQVETHLKSEIWTDNYITIYIDNIRQASEPNRLQYLPFVSFKGEEVYGQYLGHAPATAIRQLNAYINQQLTNLGFMIKMQSATPIVLTGFQQGEGVVIHPGRAMSLPAGATASALTLNPAIAETLQEIQFLEAKIYETSSIPKISVTGEDQGSTSGQQLLIKWAPILQVFKAKAMRYRKYELSMFNMILKINKLDPIEDINIKFPEDSLLPYSPDDANLERDVRLGIKTPIDQLLSDNPTLDEKDAEVIVRANLDFNSSLNPGGLNGSGTQTGGNSNTPTV